MRCQPPRQARGACKSWMSIASQILNANKILKLKNNKLLLHTNHKTWDYISLSGKERSFLLLSTCDIWKRKRLRARPGWKVANTSQRGFQKAWPVNACIVFLLSSHRRLNILLGPPTEVFFLYLRFQHLIPSLFGKNLKSGRMWSGVWKCVATYGIHNSEKWSGTFIRSQCERPKSGVQGRRTGDALVSDYQTPISIHTHACFIALLPCVGASTLWHRLLMPLTVLLLPPSLYQ